MSNKDMNKDNNKDPKKTHTLHTSWYRGPNTNFLMPRRYYVEEYFEKLVFKGWLPDKPFIDKNMQITAFGSCFAAHASKFLQDNGYNVNDIKNQDKNIDAAPSYIQFYGAGMNTTFAIRQQFEWALEDKVFDEELWYNENGKSIGYAKDVQQATKKQFLNTKVFILTLGLSEVWYNKINGEVFWRAIPEDKFDEKIHGFKVSTVGENIENLEKIHSLIRKHNPDATIVLTLSPVPLAATFRPVSCITASSVSKSILRVATDEFYRSQPNDNNLFYWPSYELIKDVYDNPYKEDNRHIQPPIVKGIMNMFKKYYCIQ